MTEDRQTRLKRLHMRSMRRGIKEMDIILSRYAEARLAHLDAAQLDDYDALLSENDQDLYQWVTGQVPAPHRFTALLADISDTALAPK
ncbi:succinate dehydrogenase assembly factor 2 [uncultured Roseovarius sp.]|uniref:succinate dehydrogenase assembly factor 2 n=1 Tax=uncultured Roseovarius sp. TaxID=293344 RepID=UPI00261F4CEB|nr:succinate dehydrogenase assembly factor 2 [uncultured Roseovarius sp.]